tara:strand:+ start:235 stop:501 length:267 start_codon:yes stop_codon:yes gene_type:complete
MSLIKKFALSSKLFSYYEKDIDMMTVDSIEEIIILVVSELNDLLLKNNLEILAEKLNEGKWHIHDVSFEEIKKESSPAKFYICDHPHD